MSVKETHPLLSGNSVREFRRHSFVAFFKSFWLLGLVAFGGPSAHVALLHDKYVDAADGASIDEATFIELFALSSALPGPGSTQLATALGATFGGLFGALLCFFVWLLPGALAMAFAGVWFHKSLHSGEYVNLIGSINDHSIGLISAAFAMVVLASFKITEKTCSNSKLKMLVCLCTAIVAVLVPPSTASWVYLTCLAAGGTCVLIQTKLNGAAGNERPAGDGMMDWRSGINPKSGASLLFVFGVITTVLTMWDPAGPGGKLLKAFWRIGWTVFGGGQVVIPMILNEVVESGWLPSSVFLSGFGLVGCLPGPMFNIAPFVGAVILSWRGAIYATLGLFGPGIVLILALLPFWEHVRKWGDVRLFLSGVNASAAGLIIAGVWMLLHRTLVGPLAFALALAAGVSSAVFKMQTPFVILGCGGIGAFAVTCGIGGPFH
jgi:chromate transporter